MEKDYVLVEDFAVSTKEPSVYEAKEIAAFAASQFLEGKIDEFRVVYTRMRSIVLLEPTMQVLLPLDAKALAKARRSARPRRAPDSDVSPIATFRARKASSTSWCRSTSRASCTGPSSRPSRASRPRA